VTVAMSDRDYAILLAAIGWIENHAGKDAPDYPEIEILTHVVNNISQRREPSDGPIPRSFGAERTSEHEGFTASTRPRQFTRRSIRRPRLVDPYGASKPPAHSHRFAAGLGGGRCVVQRLPAVVDQLRARRYPPAARHDQASAGSADTCRHDVACLRSAWPDASGGTPAVGALRDGVSDLNKPTVRSRT